MTKIKFLYMQSNSCSVTLSLARPGVRGAARDFYCVLHSHPWSWLTLSEHDTRFLLSVTARPFSIPRSIELDLVSSQRYRSPPSVCSFSLSFRPVPLINFFPATPHPSWLVPLAASARSSYALVCTFVRLQRRPC